MLPDYNDDYNPEEDNDCFEEDEFYFDDDDLRLLLLSKTLNDLEEETKDASE